MHVLGRLFGTACLMVLGAGFLGAQTNTAEVRGVIKDSTGAVIPSTSVLARNPSTGVLISRVTDSEGRFLFAGLQPGQWEITATIPGFEKQTQRVPLEIGRTVDIEFSLVIEGIAQEIAIVNTDPLLQTATAEISDVIENREVVQIPINGRNFLSLAQLSDAVVLPPTGTRGDALQQAGALPNVGGQRSGHNIYLLDGAKVTDELFNNLVINPSLDSIQEFKIQKSMYPAEFGGKASALINVATKAGTNFFHGSLFEFYRNDAFDAPNYFARDQSVPPLKQHQFGGAIGGPLVKDRAFFFLSYEGLRMDRTLTRTFTVPDDEARNGQFGSSICDPVTRDLTSGVCTTFFLGNKIPSERLDPIATEFLKSVPRANAIGPRNLTSFERQKRDIDQFSVRLDHRLSNADQLFGRFSTFDADESQPFGTSILQEALVPGFGRALSTKTRNVSASHTHVFGSALLNELRFGWMTVKGGQTSVNRGADFANRVGLLGVTNDFRDMGFPQVSTSGQFATMGDPASFVFRNNQHFELFENILIDRGKHKIKFGAYYFHLQLRPEQPDNARGAFTYTGQFSGNAFADFLLGYPASAVVGLGRGEEDGRTRWLHAYAQDDWRIRDNLTVNVGIRYEFNQHMYDVEDRLSSVDLSVPGGRFVIASDDRGTISPAATSLLPLIPIPFVTSREAGWNRGLLKPSAVRLAPRFGFSLKFNNSKSVIRGGYGIFLNQWAYSVQTAFSRNLPFFFTKQVDAGNATIPPFRTRDILITTATGTVSPSIMDHDYHVEYSQTWSVGLQQELLASTVLELAYMGTWTIGADNATVRNVPDPGPGAIQARRPIPALGRINAIRFDGKSIYHGLTLKAERRMRNHFAFNTSYTLSSSKDDASSPGATESETNVPQDVRNLFGVGGEWAHSSFDHRHQFVASGAYEFPFFDTAHGLKAATLANWRVNTIFTAQSGAPFTVNLGVDQANIGTGLAQRPDQARDPNLRPKQRTPDRWFDTAAFSLPAQYTFGTAPRNSVIGPGSATLDIAISKQWSVGEPSRLEFRWEIFNLLNRTNFDLPNRIFGTTSFARIFSAKSPREMQFGLRLSY